MPDILRNNSYCWIPEGFAFQMDRLLLKKVSCTNQMFKPILFTLKEFSAV